ncbi:ABC transporter ATP-binding protein [Ruegeria pomeroyi]|uniref:Branched-chain amino acid ABC transporter, ATP-binding protein n=2 Tax=Ruegeria pomeroyi TaxID=89184 RepID=Q5LM57_RUEPO|nr:ABC transporter ATP-binding protein [Ruegeria pomeroyi]HCE71521.1 ABC transporter ATP-binding protein [Ruegeria sp.]AAV96928.1 branched-chain amino acid ABC transporter, ATP-binding protein [Ruegeria pomeroyi DSS-3]NVK97909.1 ABC transporter ATP-binding protein [Ruegeria pomeroyi]NVL02411.1 ABC transporter ATP-binding protein [Ruegeria pomeroyi]QWV10456.1 ABC transporter ATP-binding protein [Ruegeria pomeroyi]
MSDPILRLEGVYTNIAQYHILQGVDLEVPRGAVTMLLGRNGVGKTTTLRSIIGHWRAHQGRILLDGQDITRMPTPAIARAGVGFVPEDMGIFANLTVEENMVLAAVSGPIDSARLDWVFQAFPPLKTFWKSEAGNLSGGQKQMLSIARAMVEERRLYLIDEPTKGLAPAIVSTMARALRELKAQGASILLVEQNFSVARALGDSACVMDDGRIIWSGEMRELVTDAALQERLMGLSMEAH